MIQTHATLAFHIYLLLYFQYAHGGIPASIDVVSVALKPSCVSRATIESLNRYLVPPPRHIYIITQVSCPIWESFAPNVICRLEADVVPGLSLEWVLGRLEAGLAARPHAFARLRGRAGWFLQQLLKMAAASGALPGLTPHMLLWDSDMIVLQPMELFVPSAAGNSTVVHSSRAPAALPSGTAPAGTTNDAATAANPTATTSGTAPRRAAGRHLSQAVTASMPTPSHVSAAAATAAAACINPFPFTVRRHIGGYAVKPYAATYAALTHGSAGPAFRAPDGSSLVAHHMVVHVPYMRELMDAILAGRRATEAAAGGVAAGGAAQAGRRLAGNGGEANGPLGWAAAVLEAVASLSGTGAMHFGFSEYESYGSWVQARHPCTVSLAVRREWTRSTYGWPALVPVAGAAAVVGVAAAAAAAAEEGAGGGGGAAAPNDTRVLPVCCPTRDLLSGGRARGVLFAGFELGHAPGCHYHHPAFRADYASWYSEGAWGAVKEG